ncbi:MAG: monovalent cation/H+ antiporter subunit D family protein, partial [Deltaproteobacteria bacterium]|nr:monovalent cation/H+ antiporter subunit D family protein [Deltaproteobacteria bacterium]
MTAHLPILQVIIPLLAAPLCLFIRIPRIVGIFAILVSAIAFLISCGLLQEVITGVILSYQLGGWAAPWGIEYRIDKLNGYLLLLVSGVSTIVLV